MTVERSKLLSAIQNKVPSSEVASQLCDSEWKRMQFNKSGKQILVTTNSGLIVMVDGYNGSITNVFVSDGCKGNTPSRKTSAPACFSEDDNTVFCGNEDGSISCLDATTGVLVKKLEGHVGGVTCIATNPKFQQIASTCTNTAIWNIP
jgi:COMPASS component SWD2